MGNYSEGPIPFDQKDNSQIMEHMEDWEIWDNGDNILRNEQGYLSIRAAMRMYIRPLILDAANPKV